MAATERLEVNRQSRERLRPWAIGALVAAALLVAAAWRIATETAPPLAMQRTLPAAVRFPGSPPLLAWPGGGQAAVEVEGVGSFGSSGESTPVPIASVAKVMTAYLTLRAHPLAAGQQGFVMTVTPADVREEQQRASLGQSTLQVRAGEQISERQALQALLLPSANNIAVMLAEHDAGGVTGFVAHMNDTARALGMGSTTYTDPSGYQRTTVSTAADQLRLARAAMSDAVFAAIVDEPSAQLPVAGLVTNYDGLVGQDGYVGVKTGSDRAAGGCLIFAKRVVIGGRRLTVLGAVLDQREGSPIEAALTSAERLGDSAAGALRVRTLLPAGTRVLSVASPDGGRTSAAHRERAARDRLGGVGRAGARGARCRAAAAARRTAAGDGQRARRARSHDRSAGGRIARRSVVWLASATPALIRAMSRERWMALFFASGSACFLVGPFPGYASLVGDRADSVTFFVGSVLFTLGGLVQTWLALPERRSPGIGRATWWAATIQSAGTLFFNVTTYRAMHTALSSSEYNRLVWRPDALGSVCFLVSGAIAYRASARHGWLPVRGARGWWEPSLNLLGCVFFGISAVAGHVVPTTGSMLDLAASNWNTSLGAACFLACAAATLRSGRTLKSPRLRRLHKLEHAVAHDVKRVT